MVTAKRVIDIPLQTKLVDENGQIAQPWLEHFIIVSQAVSKLRDGAEAMETLTSSSTATEMIDAWEELRGILQEIT